MAALRRIGLASLIACACGGTSGTVGPSAVDSDAGDTSDIAAFDAGTDARTSSPDASTDAGAPSTVGVFVATGLVGRTIASFDDGQSWEADTSDEPGVICTSPTPSQCYEGTRTARGVTFLDERFFTTFAWTREATRSNSVRASDDGRAWTPVLTPGGFGGIAAGNGAVALAGPSGTTYMMVSTDLGKTWTKVPNGYGSWVNFRHVAFVPAKGGRFVFGGDGNGFDTSAHVVTSTDGATWKIPTTIPAGCPSGFRLTGGFGSVGDRMLMVGSSGTVCFSDDGGDTWALGTAIGTPLTSHDVVSTGDRVWAWSGTSVFTTTDGMTWTETPLSPAKVSIGAIAWSPDTKTFVAVTSGYLNGYTKQHFYRSSDGANWVELPADKYVQSHPIVGIAYGRVAAQ